MPTWPWLLAFLEDKSNQFETNLSLWSMETVPSTDRTVQIAIEYLVSEDTI
jgi:hypothetical protein